MDADRRSPKLDGPALARSLGIAPSTIRAWASAGLIERHGKDARGRNLYDVDAVIGVSQSGATGVSAARRLRSHRTELADVRPDLDGAS